MSWVNKSPSDAFASTLRSLVEEVVKEYLSGLPKLDIDITKCPNKVGCSKELKLINECCKELININDVKAFKKPKANAKPRASRAKKVVEDEAKVAEVSAKDASPNVSDN